MSTNTTVQAVNQEDPRLELFREHFSFKCLRCHWIEALTDKYRIALFLDHHRAFFGGPNVAAGQDFDFNLHRLRVRSRRLRMPAA